MICIKLLQILICIFIANAERIPITMVTTHPFQAESRNPFPEYYCYLSSMDKDAVVSSTRVLETRANNDNKNVNNNPAPPMPVVQQGAMYPPDSAVYKVTLNFGGTSANAFAYGTFSCDASRSGRADSTVSNILMNSESYTYPEDGLVTQTVNMDDRGVQIRMDGAQDVNRWHRNNLIDILGNRNFDFTGMNLILNFKLNISKSKDEGFYQTLSGSLNRQDSRHGLKRLIVRSCPSNHWAPPTCYGVCDNCYNGGICDDETGRCICPPGFMGANCLTACSDDQFGLSCEFRCTSDDCKGLQFCLLDPYGCRCGAGWKGLDCLTACGSSKFGASCLQECNCDGTCDRFTGSCSGSCESGWGGFNCQIPDVCPVGYYGPNCTSICNCRNGVQCDTLTGECPNQQCGPGYVVPPASVTCQECQGAYFGQLCQEECHCAEEACNKLNGQCCGQCKPQWVDASQCLVGFEEATSSKINPGTSTDVICVLQGSSLLRAGLSLHLSREEAQLVSNGIQELTAFSVGDVYTGEFRADNVTDRDKVFCLVVDQEDEIVAVLGTTVNEYVLPVLTSPPSLLHANVSLIAIEWSAWDAVKDMGEPPIVAYIPYYRKISTKEWIAGPINNTSLTFTVVNLDSDTLYVFSVAAVREGENGEGPRSPEVSFRTHCDVAEISPVDVVAYLDVISNAVNVSWQIPEDIVCTTGILFFNIYVEEVGIAGNPKLHKRIGDIRWAILKNLKKGNYTFLVTFTIDTESDFSETSEVISIVEDLTGTPDATTIPGTTAGGTDTGVVILVVILIVILVLVSGVAVFIIMRKRKLTRDKEQNCHANVGYNQNEVTLELENAYQAVGSNVVKPNQEKDQFPVKTLGDETESEDEIKEGEKTQESDSEDKDHDNLQKPDAVRVDSLQQYFNHNLQEGRLEQEFSLLKSSKQYPWTVGEKKENRQKNRFRNMYTYDHSRVILKTIAEDDHSDYYNASHIMTPDEKKLFIAAQGPNTASLNDFWRMVWSKNVSTIVMVTNLIEKGKDRCLQYWPNKVGSSQKFGHVQVTWQESTEFADYVIRKLFVVQFEESRVVHQFHFISWPDMGTPKQPTPLITFAQHVKQMHGTEETTPMVVHCSAGVGRTGTFIALYSLLDVIFTEEYLNVFNFVETLRESRINMVQTWKQYVYLYKCLVEAYLTNQTVTTKQKMTHLAEDLNQEAPKKEYELLQVLEKEDMVYIDYLKKQANGRRPFSISETSYNLTFCLDGTLLKSYKKKDAYVATNYPQNGEVAGFWKLIYTWKCPLIVSLDQPDDKPCYWPDSGSVKYSVFSIDCKDTEITPDFTIRRFEVTQGNGKNAVTVHHLQLTSGPARGDFDAFMKLIKRVQNLQIMATLDGPTVVHCLDDSGLCGVFVAVLLEIERFEDTGNFDVFKTVRQLKETNESMLDSEMDYVLCYKMLYTYLQGNSTYQNI
ncbi:uncharacterized protein [Apostichopus japonicus]|uniref:uncharacterized protein isoform X2 n=1 Tax=Stichopus japonicus TaxID=307972 RepID=UPI003AB3236B